MGTQRANRERVKEFSSHLRRANADRRPPPGPGQPRSAQREPTAREKVRSGLRASDARARACAQGVWSGWQALEFAKRVPKPAVAKPPAPAPRPIASAGPTRAHAAEASPAHQRRRRRATSASSPVSSQRAPLQGAAGGDESEHGLASERDEEADSLAVLLAQHDRLRAKAEAIGQGYA